MNVLKKCLQATLCILSISTSSIVIAKTSNDAHHHKTNRKYYTFNYPEQASGGETLLTGIRKVSGKHNSYYISGFYKYPNGASVISFVYKGPLSGNGTWNTLNYPSSSGITVLETNLYGPNNGPRSEIQVVGNYTTEETGASAIGCLYEGPLDGSGKWTSLIPTSSSQVLDTIAHSTMGGLVVGNYNTQPHVSKAFIYDIKKGVYHDIKKPEAVDITAYGIWHNGGHSYTICGGYSNADVISGLDSAYLVDWNNKKRRFSNWRTFSYKNDPLKAVVTHFDGITSDGNGGYNLTGDWSGVADGPQSGFFCNVRGNKATWSSISFPHHKLTSGNSVSQKIVIGVYPSNKTNSVYGYISIP